MSLPKSSNNAIKGKDFNRLIIESPAFYSTGKEIRYDWNRCADTFGFLQHAA